MFVYMCIAAYMCLCIFERIKNAPENKIFSKYAVCMYVCICCVCVFVCVYVCIACSHVFVLLALADRLKGSETGFGYSPYY